MRSSDEIFLLVKSLSKQEKSYFKKSVSAFTDEVNSNYIKLFDEIVRQASAGDNYDEGKIKKGNYSGKFLKNLPVHKNYLYNLILSSMTNYRKDNKLMITLRNLISQSEILIEKLLHEQSRKVLNRAKKIAKDNDIYTYEFEIQNLELQINKNTLSFDEFSKSGDEIMEQQIKILDKLRNIREYYFLHNIYSNLVKKSATGYTRSQDELSEIDVLFENDLLKNEDNAKTFESRNFYLTMHLQYSLTNSDNEKAYSFISRSVKLWEDNYPKICINLEKYIYALNNLLTCQIRTKRFDECEETSIKMKNIEKKFPKLITEKNKVFIFYSTSVLMLSKYMENIDPVKLDKLNKSIDSEITQYENKIELHRKIILFYFLSTSNFIMDRFEKSIYYTGRIINMEKTELSQDYQCYARIIYLISFYELGHFDSLEYALKSVYHFMSKRERVYKYENILLQYLRRSFRIRSKKELIEMFSDMKKDMEKIRYDPFEQNAFDAFNILIWLESKVRNVSMIDVITQDVRRKSLNVKRKTLNVNC